MSMEDAAVDLWVQLFASAPLMEARLLAAVAAIGSR
jgi:hypothetical protein